MDFIYMPLVFFRFFLVVFENVVCVVVCVFCGCSCFCLFCYSSCCWWLGFLGSLPVAG